MSADNWFELVLLVNVFVWARFGYAHGRLVEQREWIERARQRRGERS